MRSALICIVGVLAAAASALGQEAAEARGPGVLVLPFVQLAEQKELAWIGEAVQRSLNNELARQSQYRVVSPATQPAQREDLEVAKSAAQKAGAQKVVFGSFQIINEELRITGQVYDLDAGGYVGSLKATGALRDLFALQDELGEQLLKLLKVPAAEAVAFPPPVRAPEVDPKTFRAPEPWDVDRSEWHYRYSPPAYFYSGYYCPPYRPCYYRPYYYSRPRVSYPVIIIYPPKSDPPAKQGRVYKPH